MFALYKVEITVETDTVLSLSGKDIEVSFSAGIFLLDHFNQKSSHNC